MTPEDLNRLRGVAERLPNFRSVGILSGLPHGEMKLFPNAASIPRWKWDLNKPGKKRYDLLVACNVFMYSPDPERWLRHVLASCKYFVLQDVVRRRRSEASEYGNDADAARYAVGDERPRVESFFDLNTLEDRVCGFSTYEADATPYDDSPRHFVAVLRGDLAAPVIRIDDYPTGIRPILPDLSPIHAILEEFEKRSLPYRLGIVPALLDADMISFLRRLEMMIPVVHGYDHAYPRFAPLLIHRGDPFNEHTVRTLNEFARTPYDAILEKLKKARRLLEDRLQKEVDTYIPPGNRSNRRTGRALVAAGYRYYMSEKRIPFCPLPHFASDFYGRSNDYPFDREPDIVTLHATWEWDLVRNGDGASLRDLVAHLQDRHSAAQDLERRVAGAAANGSGR